MDKPKKSFVVNVCIIPSHYVSDLCTKVSQSLKSNDTIFTIGEGKFAHMTVFMARFDENDLNNVIKGVEITLKSFTPFACDHLGYFITKGRYAEVSYLKSMELLNLQKSLIDNISRYRVSPGAPYEESYFAPYNDEQKRNAASTGYDLSGELYRPHITLTRYVEGKVPKSSLIWPDANLSFSVETICVCMADDNGAVYETLASFDI